VVESVDNPHPELRSREELILLTQNIQLRIPVQNSCRYELIKHSDDQRWKNSEHDVVE
jgi:hypothetical protein